MVQMSHQVRTEAEDLKVIPTENSIEPMKMDRLSTERERERERSKMILASTPILAGQIN